MITFTRHGNHGRLCNQFFQWASLHAIAKKYDVELVLPKWNYARYFTSEFPEWKTPPKPTHHPYEQIFNYHPEFFEELKEQMKTGCVNFTGYFQSEKYFEDCKEDIVKNFTFKPDFIEQVKQKINIADWSKKNIVIQVRRTDYVNNPNYYQLPITFYLSALIDHFPNYEECNIILVTDDLNYCHQHFDCLPNAYFVEKFSDIEQVCLMSLCDGFIIANGTFGWWGAWLAEQQREVKVVHSPELFAGPLLEKNGPAKDFYPERWISHEGHKLDLKDCTFTIPVLYDHEDRKQNLDLCVCMLQKCFETNIIIGEQGGNKFMYHKQWSRYIMFDYKDFHRTRMLNQMALIAETPVIANWDCDVIIAPMQIYMAVKAIMNGAPMCYPYDGTFIRMSRHHWFKPIEKALDIGIACVDGNGSQVKSYGSTGGAVLVNKEKFIESGMENENMISFAPEDWERMDRWKILGYDVQRIKGSLYHIDHHIGVNSSGANPFFKKNHDEHTKVKMMNKEQLKEYVSTWEWVKELTEKV